MGKVKLELIKLYGVFAIDSPTDAMAKEAVMPAYDTTPKYQVKTETGAAAVRQSHIASSLPLFKKNGVKPA